MNEQTIFGLEDFASGSAFEALDIASLPLAEREVKLSQLKKQAVELGLSKTQFNRISADYLKRKSRPATRNAEPARVMALPGGYEMEPWFIDGQMRVCRTAADTTICACNHPIYIAQRMKNIITDEQKVELAFSRDGETWKHVIVNRSVISSARSITQLNELGISATSENAKQLVAYLQHFEDVNYAALPMTKSVNRFGWIGNYSFSPYAEDDGVIFDSQSSFIEIRSALQPGGSYDEWLKAAKEIRHGDELIPKIFLATSFASALIQPLECMPFFLHIWGHSGTGKSVMLMLAASVWADPKLGRYIKSFNSTAVAQETLAGTLYSLPLILDELQSVKDQKSFDKLIYELSEGTGRARGTVSGGLRETLTWENCVLTSGEQPITRELSGGGAKNRIIEVVCDRSLFADPIRTVKQVKANYGFAGREFVEKLTPEIIKRAKICQESVFSDLVEGGYTGKQSLAASIIVTAECLISELIFNEPVSFEPQDIATLLSDEKEISVERRAYTWLRDWIVANDAKFDEDNTIAIYGKHTPDGTAILPSVLREACEERGVSFEALTHFLDRNGLLVKDLQGKRAKLVRICGKVARCYVIAPEFEDE